MRFGDRPNCLIASGSRHCGECISSIFHRRARYGCLWDNRALNHCVPIRFLFFRIGRFAALGSCRMRRVPGAALGSPFPSQPPAARDENYHGRPQRHACSNTTPITTARHACDELNCRAESRIRGARQPITTGCLTPDQVTEINQERIGRRPIPTATRCRNWTPEMVGVDYRGIFRPRLFSVRPAGPQWRRQVTPQESNPPRSVPGASMGTVASARPDAAGAAIPTVTARRRRLPFR